MAADAEDSKFVSCLDEKSKEKARKELHELNDKDRELAVQTLRKWVCDQDWMRTPTDFEFLLRFLRVRKYSQLGARQTMENYWRCKEHIPTIYRNIDPAEPSLKDILKHGFAFGHKKTDQEGRRILFTRPGCVTLDKLKEIGLHNWYKCFMLVLEWIMFDENSQVNGVRIVNDLSGMGFQLYLAYANIDDQKTMMKFLQKSLPVRLKGMYMYNEPSFLDVLLGFFTPFMTQKFHERLVVVGNNLANLYDPVEKSVLPNEYLPDDYTGHRVGSIDKVIDEMIADMNTPKFREYICAVTSNKYGMDCKKRAEMEQEPAASFRKLNVD